MRNAWPFVRAAFGELWVAALLGLAAGFAIAFASDSATLPLAALAVAGLWGGVVAGGGTRAKLVHLLSRPIDRRTVLALRLGVLASLLFLVGLALHIVVLALALRGDGPSLWFMVLTTGVCTIAGVVAGALADHETTAVGGAVIGASLVVLPPVLFGIAIDLTWLRVDGALGFMRWPFAIAALATSMLPLLHAWSTLPCRNRRGLFRIAKLGLGVAAFQFALGWVPLAVVASSPAAGELIAVYRGPEGERVLLTGSRFENDNHIGDGLILGDAREVVFDARWLETIETLQPSPEGSLFAIVLRKSDRESRLAIVRIATGESFAIEDSDRPTAVWSQDGTHLLVEYPDEAVVYRVGAGIDRVSQHVMRWQGATTAPEDGVHPNIAAWNDRLVADSDVPTDIGGGWIGGDVAWLSAEPEPRLRVFDGSTHTIRSVAIAVEPMVVKRQPPGRWLDERHVAVLVQRDPFRRGSAQRLLVVDLDGEVVADAPVDNWLGVERIEGPPQGPWVVLTKSGDVEAWAEDGRSLWKESVTAFGRFPVQLPWVLDGDTIAAVDRDGRMWQRPLPWSGGFE